MNPDGKQFNAALREELSRLQEQQVRMVKEIQNLEEKIAAINRLLADEVTNNKVENKSVQAAEPSHQPIASISKGKKGSYTQVDVYWPATLKSLVELGGSAPSDQVIDSVGKRLESILTNEDRKLLPSGTDIRWKNRVAWQRYNMIKQGLLRGDSPRGIWEITERGRRWLAELENEVRARSQAK